MTPQEFAAKIKAKYPQYADMDDLELSQKIIAKYPQYQDMVTESGAGDPLIQPGSAMDLLSQPEPSLWEKYQGALAWPAKKLQEGYEKVGAEKYLLGHPKTVGAAVESLNPLIQMNVKPAEMLMEHFGGNIGKGLSTASREMRQGMMGDPLMYATRGGKLVNAALAPGIWASMGSGLNEAIQIYHAEGASENFWKAIGHLGGSVVFSALIARGLSEGKPVEQAIKDAGESGPAASPQTDTGTPSEPPPMPDMYGKMPARPEPRTPVQEPPPEVGAVDFSRIPQFGQERQGNLEAPPAEAPATPEPPSPDLLQTGDWRTAQALYQRAMGKLQGLGGEKKAPSGKPGKDPFSRQIAAMDASDSIVEKIREAGLKFLPEFTPPGKTPEVAYEPTGNIAGNEGFTARPGQPSTTELRQMSEDYSGGWGFPDTVFRVDARQIARDTLQIHGGKPLVVQARLFLNSLADTVLHEMAHGVDFNRSLHAEEESSIPGFSKGERFELVNDMLQRKARPQVVEILKKIPDMEAVKMYMDLTGAGKISDKSLKNLLMTELSAGKPSLRKQIQEGLKEPNPWKEKSQEEVFQGFTETPAKPTFTRPDNAFTRLADAQRGEPESKMLKAANALGGGVMQYVIEHVGDLTHRMSEGAGWGRMGTDVGFETTMDKINKVLSTLTHTYGFGKEHLENLAANAQYHGVDPSTYKTRAHAALQEWADANKKLPVVNEAQRLAQSAAISIGELRIPDAVRNLQTLKEMISTPEKYAAEVWKEETPQEAAQKMELQEAFKPKPGESGAVSIGLLTDPIISIYKSARRLKKGGDKLVGKGVDMAGDWLRSSVAGDIGTSARNVTSGFRMIGQSFVANPMAAALAEGRARWYEMLGDTQRASQAHDAAKNFMEITRQLPQVLPREAAESLLDLWGVITEKGRLQQHGEFENRLKALEAFGLQKEATSMRQMTSPEFVSREGGTPLWKKGLMLLNIMGDRFINRTYLAAHMQAIQKTFGVSDAAGLAKLAKDPTMRPIIKNYLENASAEAMRAAWNLPYAFGGKFQAVVRDWAQTPVVGILTMPFGRAFAANFLPNIAETMPGLHLLSKRVQNSYAHESLEILHRELQAQLKVLPSGTQQHLDVANKMAETTTRMRKLRETQIYSPDMIRARTMLGPMFIAGAMSLRVLLGDNGSEFDELALGKDAQGKIKTGSITGQVGEMLPWIFVGDYLGHLLLSNPDAVRGALPDAVQEVLDRNRTPYFKYQRKEGPIGAQDLMAGALSALANTGKAFYGSRYGYTNPASEILFSLADMVSGKKEPSEDYLKEMGLRVISDVGKMATAGGWVGGIGRAMGREFGTPWSTPAEEQTQRRTDLSPWAGAVSQIPGMGTATGLPPVQRWTTGEEGKNVTPLPSALIGVTQREYGPVEQFMNQHQGVVQAGDILPRRTQDPKFDALYNARFSQALQGRILPMFQREGWSGKGEAEKVEEFTAAMKRAREWAHSMALRDYRRETGTLPEESFKGGEKREERKGSERLRRGAPRFPKRKEPRPTRGQLQQHQKEEE